MLRMRSSIAVILLLVFATTAMGALTVRGRQRTYKGRGSGYFLAASLSEAQKEMVVSVIDEVNDKINEGFGFCFALRQVEREEEAVVLVRRTTSLRLCSTNGVGRPRNGEKQFINIAGCKLSDAREARPLIMQNVLQVLGVFHEQRRLDRGDHIVAFPQRLRRSHRFLLQRVNWSTGDNKGLPYDPQSVMHSRGNDFTTGNTPAIRSRTGTPLGGSTMSPTDVLGIKRLYFCRPSPLLEGKIRVDIVFQTGFPEETDGTRRLFVDTTEQRLSGRQRNKFFRTADSVFIEPGRYLFLRVFMEGLFPGDLFARKLTQGHLIPITDGVSSHEFCRTPTDCSFKVQLRITFFEGPDPCFSDPCKLAENPNVLRCINFDRRHECECQRGFRGDFCEKEEGRLRVFIDRAENLPDKDNDIFGGSSDSYVRVTAISGGVRTIESRTISSHNPRWSETIEFPEDDYDRVVIEVLDRDGALRGEDDFLMAVRGFAISPKFGRQDLSYRSGVSTFHGHAIYPA